MIMIIKQFPIDMLHIIQKLVNSPAFAENVAIIFHLGLVLS